MESFTDLPETLASMTLVNNINSDILANKGQIKSMIQSNVNGLKSFHHNTCNLIDNQIHHHVLNTTQHEHGNIIDTKTTTNKIIKLEDRNNNKHSCLNEIRSFSDESDCDLFTDDSFESNEEENMETIDENAKQINNMVTKMRNIDKPHALNSNAFKRHVPAIKESVRMNYSNKILRKNDPSKRSTPLSLKLQKAKKTLLSLPKADETSEHTRLILKRGKDLQDKIVPGKKLNEVHTQVDNKITSSLIQRRKKELDFEEASQVCDLSPATCNGLLSYSEMPPHLQFNPYITSGYRPILDAWGCLRSLCYVHNETVNIFTHGLPIIYILLTVPRTMPWYLQDTRSQLLIWSHLAGATCPWMGSMLYHLFMNCGSNPLMYRRLLQIDMFGIWISQSFGALPMLFASVHCLSSNIRLIVIASYCLFSICGLRKALIATTPWSRRICFALPFMMRNLLCLLRLTKYGGGAPDSLAPTILQDVMCILGGVIGAEKVPERWWPGTTDLCFNSHNIMHVLALLALYYNNRGSVRDIEWMRSTKNPCFAGPLLHKQG